MNVAFWLNALCERGTAIAVYDYAYYNQKMFGNTSYIFYERNNPQNVKEVVEKFQKDNPKFKISWDGFKIGEIGCFISHYIAWNYLLNSELDELLIFEDDVFIDETFVKKYQLAINNVPEDYDVLSIFVDSNQHDRFKESDKINYYISKGYQDWSTLCYIISKQGAEKLCKYVEEIGMDHPADWFIFRKGHAGIFNVYTLPPYIKNPVNIDKRYDSQVQ